MLFQIKEKFWSWGDDFSIKDENGTPLFTVKGKVFSWGDQLSFQDTKGTELAFIKQKLFSFKPKYTIFINGESFAEVIKEWSWFKKKFTLDIPGPNDYTIEGSFWTREFTFYRFGKPVAFVSKKYFSWTDTYGVEIIPGEDHVSILCACIVIDQVLYDGNNDNGSLF